jgi:hypothetical protein
MMMENKIDVQGYKYYSIEDNIIRISKDKNVINDKWTKLKMDALMAFHIISNDDGAKYIMVAMYNNGDYKNPVLIFVSNFINEWDANIGNRILGKTFNRYTGIDENLFKVIKIEYSEYVAIYKEDSFKNIYDQLINKDKFNEVLKAFNSAFIEMGNLNISLPDNLYDYMKHGAFDYDYDNELGIEQLEFDLEIDNERLINQLDLETFLGHKLIQPVIVKYNRIIVLEDIKKDYGLFRDATDTLYLVTFIRGDIIDDENLDLIEWNKSFGVR